MNSLDEIRRLTHEGITLNTESTARFQEINKLLDDTSPAIPAVVPGEPPSDAFFVLNGDNYKNFDPMNVPQPEQSWTRSLADIGDRRNVIRLEIKPGDPQWPHDRKTAKKPKRRMEYPFRKWQFDYGQEAWAGGMVYLPKDPMKSIRGCTLFQLHNNPEKGEMMQIACNGGSIYAAGKNEGGHFHIGKGVSLDPYLDRWTKVLINFRGEVGKKGFVKVWLNRKVLGEAHDIKKSGKMGPYFKCGLYYWGYESKCKGRHALAYFDDIAIGPTRASVEPA